MRSLQEIFTDLAALDVKEITPEQHMKASELTIEIDQFFGEKPVYVEPPKDPDTEDPILPDDLPDEGEGEGEGVQDAFVPNTEPGIEVRLKGGETPEEVAKLFKKVEAQEVAEKLGLSKSGTEVAILTRIQKELNK